MSLNRPPRGFVSLVGAGPGDPDLLTRKAARRLAEADVVLYDALVSREVLALAPQAQTIHVGKRCANASMTQEDIERLLVDAASKGLRVVRLKGGDPFVFGRGGEEALALLAAGIPCEVVPGISAVVAAPALAGIPVTHRGLSSAYVVIDGHHDGSYGAIIDALPPGSATVVALMAVGARTELCRRLRARGWPSSTPAALLIGMSTADEWSWTGTLGALASVVPPTASQHAPGTVVVGAVAALRLGLVSQRRNRDADACATTVAR